MCTCILGSSREKKKNRKGPSLKTVGLKKTSVFKKIYQIVHFDTEQELILEFFQFKVDSPTKTENRLFSFSSTSTSFLCSKSLQTNEPFFGADDLLFP